MRLAGVLIGIIGWVIVAFLLLYPTEVTILASSSSCGPPALVLLGGDNPIAATSTECWARSVERVLVAGGVWFVVTAGAAILLLWPKPHQQHPMPPRWPV